MSGQAIDGAHELKEITGPSALGGGSRRFFDLLWLSAITEFKLGFHGTALGFLWSLLRPLLLFSVLLVVFTHIFRFGDQVKDYPALLSWRADENDGGLLGMATGSFGDSFDPFREEHFTRKACADQSATITQ